MTVGALPLVLLALLLATQGSNAGTNGLFLGLKPKIASNGATATQEIASSTAEAGLSSVSGMATSPPMFSFPTYPAVHDFSSGTCAGYAFCFATWNPPVITEPDVMCPAGYELTNSQAAPMGQCYANWESCSGGAASAGSYMYSGDVGVGSICQARVAQPGRTCTAGKSAWAASAKVRAPVCCCGGYPPHGFRAITMTQQRSRDFGVGSICEGTPDYTAVVDGVQLVEVTSGSKWFDGGAGGDSALGAGHYGHGYAAGSGGSAAAAGDEDADTTSFQIIPSGQLVNLNGKLVHQAALDALQRQAQQQGTYIPGGAGSGGGSDAGAEPALAGQQAALDALQQQAAQQGTYIPGDAGQQAALDALQQQAAQRGTYIPGQDAAAGAAAPNAAAAGAAGSFDLPQLAPPPPKEGLLLTTVLMLLPKALIAVMFCCVVIALMRGAMCCAVLLHAPEYSRTRVWGSGRNALYRAVCKVIADELVGVGFWESCFVQLTAQNHRWRARGELCESSRCTFTRPGLWWAPWESCFVPLDAQTFAGELVASTEASKEASKEVMASLANKKEDFLPKCFSKCCTPLQHGHAACCAALSDHPCQHTRGSSNDALLRSDFAGAPLSWRTPHFLLRSALMWPGHFAVTLTCDADVACVPGSTSKPAHNANRLLNPCCRVLFSSCAVTLTCDADVVCVPASTSVNYAKPAYLCPPGCSFLDNSSKALAIRWTLLQANSNP
ncbi:hypothetical protein COO60DRAFT_1461057 [Scenedesmus sp. NREL 46B-D3]|nr:hypothetical protein COO60DRAFT_1461057 [Scenedesmus sp. NREL 46B-D3]